MGLVGLVGQISGMGFVGLIDWVGLVGPVDLVHLVGLFGLVVGLGCQLRLTLVRGCS